MSSRPGVPFFLPPSPSLFKGTVYVRLRWFQTLTFHPLLQLQLCVLYGTKSSETSCPFLFSTPSLFKGTVYNLHELEIGEKSNKAVVVTARVQPFNSFPWLIQYIRRGRIQTNDLFLRSPMSHHLYIHIILNLIVPSSPPPPAASAVTCSLQLFYGWF